MPTLSGTVAQDWAHDKASYTKRLNDINQTNVDSLVSQLKTEVAAYIQTGGLSNPDSNPRYNKVKELLEQINTVKKKYTELQHEITQYINDNAKSVDIQTLLTDNGQLQQRLQTLEKSYNDAKVDVDTAIAQDELLRSRNTKRNEHTLFLLNRPVRKQMIPILWVCSVVFIGIALIMVKMTAPTIISPELFQAMYFYVMEFISSRAVLLALLGSAIVIIIFLSLKIAGIIP